MGSAAALIDVASRQVGKKEHPAGSNICPPFTDPIPGSPWCAAFVTWCCAQVGINLKLYAKGGNSYYCPSLVLGFKAKGLLLTASSARPGDVVLFDWQRDGKADHVGIVVSNNQSTRTMVTIEGNTSAVGSQSNGGEVMRRNRPYSQIVGVGRLPFDADPAPGIAAPVDYAALRRWIAGGHKNTMAGLPNMGGGTVSLQVAQLREILEFMTGADLTKGRTDFERIAYSDDLVTAVWNYQKFMRVAVSTTDPKKGDFPGAACDFTRWSMVTILEGIRSGAI